GLLAERYEALLAALAADVDLLPVEVDVGEVEPHRLGRAQPGGVHELDERAVAQRERAVAVERVERGLDLGRLRCVRQSARAAWRKRAARHLRRPEREAQEAAHCRDLPRDRRRCELARPRAAEL